MEIWRSLRFFWDYMLRKPYTRAVRHRDSLGFREAFSVHNASGVFPTRGAETTVA